MTRDIKLYFEDIFKAIEEVEKCMKALSLDDFSKDDKVLKDVTMDFIIIGEAMPHVGWATLRQMRSAL